ncbi:polysaccharide deacetylase family protein [Bacillus suaedaesalsae]|uniref:Polysaccharide deacetylase family protein n=1 Tax=Bacillus suaedaesalsae TaxID=2810349 RepID=A0ABS2DH57_9BACI|nr:polysaccharide deacetylase family protein [Bacillus suaedaesalsae]MBM6616886.1 polysaccharide deacetylase family protein [Bacillus suaedaesalsae]
MSIYQGKVLELVSIEKIEEVPHLIIRASWYDVDRLINWKIDSLTAEHMLSIVERDTSSKYRLSLTCKYNCLSTITKTYRDQSEHIQFTCSENYANELMTLKELRTPDEFLQLPFLSFEEEETFKVVNTPTIVPQNTRKAPWFSLALLSAVLTVLLGYSSHSIMNETNLPKEQYVKAEKEQIQKVENTTEVLSTTTVTEQEIKMNPLDYTLEKELNYQLANGHVALTFDDGPSKYSLEIARILKEHNAGGTFFFIGTSAQKYPSYVKSIHQDGFSIGSHSMHHANLRHLSYSEQENEIVTSIELIQSLTEEEVVLFRPPYGSKNGITEEILNKLQHKVVLWNKDTEDWKNRNPDSIINYIKNTNPSGSIILLHESQDVVDALPTILEYFKEQNLKVVNLK